MAGAANNKEASGSAGLFVITCVQVDEGVY